MNEFWILILKKKRMTHMTDMWFSWILMCIIMFIFASFCTVSNLILNMLCLPPRVWTPVNCWLQPQKRGIVTRCKYGHFYNSQLPFPWLPTLFICSRMYLFVSRRHHGLVSSFNFTLRYIDDPISLKNI